MPGKPYPDSKYGSETAVEINTETGDSVEIHEDIYNGGVTRKLKISSDSIKIEDEKTIVEKIFELYKEKQNGLLLGFSVDATAYHPQSFKVTRIVVKRIKFADK